MRKGLSKEKIYCVLSAVIIFGAYISQRIINLTLSPSRTLLISQAFIYSLLTLIVYLLIVNSKDYFYGILIACFGVRMMPPDILNSLNQISKSAGLVYFIVTKMAVVIFVIAIIKLYNKQENPKAIKPIPILALLLVVPFSNEIQIAIHEYLYAFSGTMIYSYFADFTIYTVAMIVLLFIANNYSWQSTRLITDFQITALGLSTCRRICAIAINLAKGNHISKSYYCWILIYIFFILAFMYLRKKKIKTNI